MVEFTNPFRPGAGHPPPYLAGREAEKAIFSALLEQERILDNLLLTGLRGIGKTVLLEEFRGLAAGRNWQWIGADPTEQASLSEEHLAIRICADLALALSAVTPPAPSAGPSMGFGANPDRYRQPADFDYLTDIYRSTPGLSVDKLKAVIEAAWTGFAADGRTRGIVFAYDEAHSLLDHRERQEFPASVLLDAFQSLQRKGLPLMLVLAGLPMLPANLVETRTYAERMFRVAFLDRLAPKDSREAIMHPVRASGISFLPRPTVLDEIVELSGGYPYFIQFICKEAYDLAIQRLRRDERPGKIPLREIQRKLDADFFVGRWARATDRQRDLMSVIAGLDGSDEEFTVREIVEQSRQVSDKPFSSSHVNQMLAALARQGFVFRNRHGKYSFAVPLLGDFIRRQHPDVRETV